MKINDNIALLSQPKNDILNLEVRLDQVNPDNAATAATRIARRALAIQQNLTGVKMKIIRDD